MRASRVLAALALTAAWPAFAQVQPLPAGGDPHLQQVDYDAGQIVQLRGSPGYQMMIELSPDEQIQSVALGDSAAWQVSVNKEGDRLFLKPAQGDVSTNMTVVTSVRIYNFDLAALPGPDPTMPYTVQFRYPAPATQTDGQYVDVASATRRLSHYKVSGDPRLLPAQVTNDGEHTFISWPAASSIPAIYTEDTHGNDVLVNGMMGTDDVYVVDGVPDRLTFRIDTEVAHAFRVYSEETPLMPVTEIGDPRLQALFGGDDPRETGVRPVVRLPRKGLGPAALAVVALAFGVLLFVVLNGRRTSQVEPEVKLRPDSAASAWAAPPPLYVPPVPQPAPAVVVEESPKPEVAAVTAPAPLPAPQIVYAPQPIVQAPPPIPPQQPHRASSGSPLVIDTGGTPAGASQGARGTYSALVPQGEATRMRASVLANRSTTVPEGTLIPAVLETGFDSTQPGFARAVVARDVRSFDGKNVLIPRGSKLVGEYRSDVAQGQSRAVIIWTRLVRPDGMTIAMDSPAVDTTGRGGVPATVNTHFWARFGDALLQTTVGLGSALAQRSLSGPVVVLGSNSSPAAGQLVPTTNYVPTFTVPAGKSISIFVAHDLDFTAAGARG